jgi:hypothetical protein
MTIRSRALLATSIALLLIPAALTGCSQSSDKGATSSDDSSFDSSEYASCLRERGYDVEDSSDGLAMDSGGDLEAFEADSKECTKQAGGSGESNSSLADDPETKEQFRKLAQCMRDNGFEDYPDDLAAMQKFEPADQQAFATVAEKCSDEAGTGSGRTGL